MTENPEFIRSMFTSNPQMRSLLEKNPELEHILNDPQVMKEVNI